MTNLLTSYLPTILSQARHNLKVCGPIDTLYWRIFIECLKFIMYTKPPSAGIEPDFITDKNKEDGESKTIRS